MVMMMMMMMIMLSNLVRHKTRASKICNKRKSIACIMTAAGEEVARFMNKVLEDYRHLRGKSIKTCGRRFWDVVLITTADKPQQEAFGLQVEEKRNRNELPLDLPIHIVSDPPGIRIGNGGSTLTALEFLESEYGPDMYSKKILLIHAGGWSQRMPSATILGKVFSLLPHGSPPYQMLDLKLALYWPFVDKMEAGIFVTCADDFIVYCLDDGDWRLPAEGFTALAHPSPIEVGRTHGVFVIKDVTSLDTSCLVEVRGCLEILQKPNDERMKRQGAVLPGDVHMFAGGVSVEGEAVYTDSSFYFGIDVMKKLLNFKKSVGDLGCEIDAYGDFLQALGERATSDYIHLTSNVSQQTSNLLARRQAVFDCLKGSDVHVLVLNLSKFVHIGTTRELIHHFCEDDVFQREMSLEKDVFNAWPSLSMNNEEYEKQCDIKAIGGISSSACVMHSLMPGASQVAGDCVIDYCHFDIPVTIQSKCILSNCQFLCSKSSKLSSPLIIPQQMFIHTVPVFALSSTKYVTVFFHVDDNLKKSMLAADVESLPFLSSTVGSFLHSQRMNVADVLPDEIKSSQSKLTTNDSTSSAKVTLWNLKLFPALESMTLSFEEALNAMSTQVSEKAARNEWQLFSLADLLRLKDVKSMLHFRNKLFKQIQQALSKNMSDLSSLK
ncbi:fucose-1-phosphate guanylyltransferase [Elysia marginata]|uniref:Fucose-1-phosphate guanylyltransferase n=1 Tax=Elysia marginata TaxID=1093978 RepID=A0AAV4IPN1_9GAST|nr:fucose-1-phosphate guanylyltransferase [Elysia marginata]